MNSVKLKFLRENKSRAQPSPATVTYRSYIYIYIFTETAKNIALLFVSVSGSDLSIINSSTNFTTKNRHHTIFVVQVVASCRLQVAGCKGREYPLSSLGVGPGALGASAFGFAVKYRHGYYYRPDLQNATRNAPRRNFLSLTLTRIRLANRLEKGVSSPVKQQTEILRQISIILGFFFGLRRPKRQDA